MKLSAPQTANIYKWLTKGLNGTMIPSGSHEPGIDVAAWRLPEGTALRFERPDPALRPLIADYAILDSDVSVFKGPNSWLLPSSPKLWITLTPAVEVKMRGRARKELGAAMLIGPSSLTMPVKSQGGVSIVIEPTARGWARLLDVSAADLRDQIVPLEQYLSPILVVELLQRLNTSDRGTQVKAVLDDALLRHLPHEKQQEERVERIARLIACDARASDIREWHEKAGIGSARTLARLCESSFGFGPKLLQRRHRFLAVFTRMLVASEPVDFGVVPPGYHDVPHFHRDAREFLGMTARQFLAMPMTYLRAALRARQAVIGAPLSLLDKPAGVLSV